MKRKWQIKGYNIGTSIKDYDEIVELNEEEYKAKVIELDELRESERIANLDYKEKRREAILKVFPITRQLEAITEKEAGDNTLMQELKAFIQQVKQDIPKDV